MCQSVKGPELKVIRARYEPEPSSITFSKGGDDTDIILEAEFYFKADVDALFAKMSEEIKGLNEYIARLKHDNNVPHM
jgi:hypothetical protein